MRAQHWVGVVAGSLAVVVMVGLVRRPAPPWETWRPAVQALPSPNGFDGVVSAAQLAWDLPAEQQGATKETAAGRVESVERNREAVAALRRALPLRYVEPARYGYDVTFPHYARIRSLARALAVRSRWHAGRGESAEAVRCELDAAELALKVPHGGPLIGVLVGLACEAIGRADAPRVVSHLSGAEARTAAQRLEGLAAQRVELAEVVATGRQFQLASLAQALRQGSLRDLAGITLEGGSSDLPWLSSLVFGGGKSGAWRRVVRYEDDCVKAARAAGPRHAWPDPERYGAVVQMLGVGWHNCEFKLSRNACGGNLWLTALALQAWRADHGSAPDTLQALVPDYLARVPRDPFATAPLSYRLRRGEPLLYSVGPDGVDDGGQPIAVQRPEQAGTWDATSRGDVVWGVTRA